MASAARNLVVNEPLCFIFRKYGRYGAKELKSLLFDFYAGELLAAAKEELFSSVAQLKLDNVPKTITRRRRESKENPDANF